MAQIDGEIRSAIRIHGRILLHDRMAYYTYPWTGCNVLTKQKKTYSTNSYCQFWFSGESSSSHAGRSNHMRAENINRTPFIWTIFFFIMITIMLESMSIWGEAFRAGGRRRGKPPLANGSLSVLCPRTLHLTSPSRPVSSAGEGLTLRIPADGEAIGSLWKSVLGSYSSGLPFGTLLPAGDFPTEWCASSTPPFEILVFLSGEGMFTRSIPFS